MTVPLILLAVFAVILGFFGTPAWPWFANYLSGYSMPPADSGPDMARLFESPTLMLMIISTLVVLAGIRLGWALYGSVEPKAGAPDIVQRFRLPFLGDLFTLLQNKFYIDEFYEWTVIRFNAWWSLVCDRLDRWVWSGLVMLAGYAVIGLSWVSRVFDEFVINLGFDRGCDGVGLGGKWLSRMQGGRVQSYLRVIGIALAVLALILIWGCTAK